MSKDDYKQRVKHTGRNDVCPCGSGKKYKKCHLEEDEVLKHAELAFEASSRETVSGGTDSDKKDDGKINKWHREKQRVGKARNGSDTHPNIPRRGAI